MLEQSAADSRKMIGRNFLRFRDQDHDLMSWQEHAHKTDLPLQIGRAQWDGNCCLPIRLKHRERWVEPFISRVKTQREDVERFFEFWVKNRHGEIDREFRGACGTLATRPGLPKLNEARRTVPLPCKTQSQS
jgi:hypothetical protein